jgi:hypothetical protein
MARYGLDLVRFASTVSAGAQWTPVDRAMVT